MGTTTRSTTLIPTTRETVRRRPVGIWPFPRGRLRGGITSWLLISPTTIDDSFMNAPTGWLAVLAVAVGLVSPPFHRRQVQPAQGTRATPCVSDSGYQRLAFWVGDWDVFDSTGAHYATQRVSAVIDECAITAEWASSGGNKGMGLSAFDVKTHEWKQVYVSNQVPFRS